MGFAHAIRRLAFGFVAVLLGVTGTASAQPAGPEQKDPLFFELRCKDCLSFKKTPQRVAHETADIFRLKESQVVLGLGLGMALAALPIDQDVRSSVAEVEAWGRHRDDVFAVGSIGGNLLTNLGFTGTLYGIGALSDRPKLRSTGRQGFEAALLSNVIVLGIKETVGRQRPDGSDSRSFPSGHAAASFAVASVLHRNYGLRIGVPAYAFATFVAYSRINDDAHYLSDVLFGAAMGVAVGRVVSRFHLERLKVAPVLKKGTTGVVLALAF